MLYRSPKLTDFHHLLSIIAAPQLVLLVLIFVFMFLSPNKIGSRIDTK